MSVNGHVPEAIIQKTIQMAPKDWKEEDQLIGQICVTYDYTHQAWTDEPQVDFVFDVDDQIKTMLEWADHIIKTEPKTARKLRRMWLKAGTYAAQNESCSQGGEISEYLYDKHEDYFL